MRPRSRRSDQGARNAVSLASTTRPERLSEAPGIPAVAENILGNSRHEEEKKIPRFGLTVGENAFGALEPFRAENG